VIRRQEEKQWTPSKAKERTTNVRSSRFDGVTAIRNARPPANAGGISRRGEKSRAGGKKLKLRFGRFEGALADYFSAYPPIVRFVDMSELDGNQLVSPNQQVAPVLPPLGSESWSKAGALRSTEERLKSGTR